MPETEKVASIVARCVEHRTMTMGWRVGQSLGSEARLIQQYGVSRGALREAVRLLEHKQVAAMCSGPNGGLIIGALASSAIAETVSNYFNFSSVPTSDVFVARRSIESACLRLAAERMSERGIERLRDAVHSTHGADLRRAMTSLTRNPASIDNSSR